MITHKDLVEVLRYEPETGVFYWRVRNGRNIPGQVAGSIDAKGYRVISFKGRPHKSHRLAWLYVTGSWPNENIDHINGVRDDNRFSNLREATQSQNMCNQRLSASNKSGFKGVCWHKRTKKWNAQIEVGAKKIYLGLFETPDDAHKAYCDAAKIYHREFSRTE